MGRKNRYETHVQPYLSDIRKWYSTENEKQIAKRLGISETSLNAYKRDHPELLQALRDGRETLISDLKNTLKKKAQGYYYDERKTVARDEGGKKVVTVEEYHRYALPDTGAIHLLLKNLDPEWRNDDAATLELKRNKAELERQKAEAENW